MPFIILTISEKIKPYNPFILRVSCDAQANLGVGDQRSYDAFLRFLISLQFLALWNSTMQPRSKFTHSTRAPRVLYDPMLKNDLFLLFSKLAEIKVKLRIGETNYRVFGSHFDAHRRGRCFVYSLNLFLRLETKISGTGNLIF